MNPPRGGFRPGSSRGEAERPVVRYPHHGFGEGRLVSPVMLQGLHARPEPLAKVHLTGLSEVGLEVEPGIYPNEVSSVSLLSFSPFSP